MIVGRPTWLGSQRVEPLTSCPVGIWSELLLSCGSERQRDAQHRSLAG